MYLNNRGEKSFELFDIKTFLNKIKNKKKYFNFFLKISKQLKFIYFDILSIFYKLICKKFIKIFADLSIFLKKQS